MTTPVALHLHRAQTLITPGASLCTLDKRLAQMAEWLGVLYLVQENIWTIGFGVAALVALIFLD